MTSILILPIVMLMMLLLWGRFIRSFFNQTELNNDKQLISDMVFQILDKVIGNNLK